MVLIPNFPAVRLCLFPAVALILSAGSTFAQVTWTGANSNAWLDAGNWSGAGAPPDTASENALFSGSSTNLAPALSADTTIRTLSYSAGASSYTIGGNKLIISPGSVTDLITQNSGNLQVINSALELNNTTNRLITVGAGSTLTLAGSVVNTGTAGQNIEFRDSGTVNLNAAASGYNQMQQQGSVTLNINANQTSGNYILSTTSTGRVNVNVSNGRAYGAGLSASSSGKVYITSNGVNLSNTFNFRGGNNSVNTFGADIAGGGTGSVNAVTIENATRTNATHIFSSATGNVLNVTGVISGSAGAGTIFRMDGPGAVRFSGSAANTFTVPVLVNTGRLELNKTSGINAVAGGPVTLNSSGELRLLGNEQLGNSVALNMDGGLFNLNGFNESLGTLDLGASSSLTLGSTGAVSFANSSLLDWSSFNLNISGSFVDGASVRFGTDLTGLTSGQLSQITVNSIGGYTLDPNGFLTIPEPSPAVLLTTFGGLYLTFRRRRS